MFWPVVEIAENRIIVFVEFVSCSICVLLGWVSLQWGCFKQKHVSLKRMGMTSGLNQKTASTWSQIETVYTLSTRHSSGNSLIFIINWSLQMDCSSSALDEKLDCCKWSPTMGEHRLRLRPWLESMLNSNKIKGLEWLDDKKTCFKIPWKHRSKKDWDTNHVQVFMVIIIIKLERFKYV